MAAGWVSEAWPLGGLLRHGRWVDFEAWLLGWSLDDFLRHGHLVGVRGMAAEGVTELLFGGILRHCMLQQVCHCHWMGGLLNGFMRHGH